MNGYNSDTNEKQIKTDLDFKMHIEVPFLSSRLINCPAKKSSRTPLEFQVQTSSQIDGTIFIIQKKLAMLLECPGS